MTNTINKFKSFISTSWFVWLFPFIAVLITTWLFIDHFQKQGPVIKISFNESAGLQAGKTKLRYRGVVIGNVDKVEIAESIEEVIVSVSLNKDAERFAVEGSKFWVVQPKVDFQGVSGLDTLFEGTYISAQPGSTTTYKNEFKGQMRDDSFISTADTVTYYLESTNSDSINGGDSVTFRGLHVGQVTKVTLSKTAQTIIVQINIPYKFVRLIRSNTVFWKKAGIQANLGLFSSEVKINSLESILKGGIDFFTPNNFGPIAKPQATFTLLAKPPKDYEKWNPKLEK